MGQTVIYLNEDNVLKPCLDKNWHFFQGKIQNNFYFLIKYRIYNWYFLAYKKSV